MSEIGIGIIGSGYMGKAHAVAMSSVGAIFNTNLRPRLEMLCTSTLKGAARDAKKLGFKNSTDSWQKLVENEKVEAIIIASPQSTHRDITLLAAKFKKHVFCEKPLSETMDECHEMINAVENNNIINMVGFNYIRTPASQLSRDIIQSGEIGELTYFRGEHTEDFYYDPNTPSSWRTTGRANGTMGDLAPHMINASLALIGPIQSLIADIKTEHKRRPLSSQSSNETEEVTNDDHGQFICRFANGVMGHLYFSRIATGRKMGYIYEIFGTKGAIRFNQEDQNALWLYKGGNSNNINSKYQGYTKILTSPEHPDYLAFCQGPGHGTGYQDQIIIEAKDFLTAIDNGKNIWPTFRDGMEVSRIVEAAFLSHDEKRWVKVSEII